MSGRWNDGHRFADRVAIVTGASGALGGASARALAREGAKVALSYRGNADLAQQAVQEIEAAGGIACAAHLDITDPASVQAFVGDTVARYGGIDVLVNAAGRIDAADAVRFSDVDLDAWDALFDVDVKGTFLMCRAVVPHMEARGGGAIVNFTSTFGNGVNQDNMVNCCSVQYCAAKGALRGFTAALARDLAPSIRVNAISPGMIEANWDDDWETPAEHVEEAIAMTPLKRMGVPDEIAETVLFLTSDGGGYITGQMVLADGGWTLAG
ncbi:MAG: SDR family oxidoreductase [Alphaproteobacteria bacterium]|jgi:3-oxoacyl-[acyl-carrier protein] reductase|nr:SDR family oxidoreductase [Alphaproteobacteria bacterium]